MSAGTTKGTPAEQLEGKGHGKQVVDSAFTEEVARQNLVNAAQVLIQQYGWTSNDLVNEVR